MRLTLLLFSILFALKLSAQASCVGKWITIDDESGKKKSIVELYKYQDKLYGKITYLFPRAGREENPVCRECKGDMYNQPLIGLKIVRFLSWNGEEWSGGSIVDPENGKSYSCKMWLQDGNPDLLNVRGYIGPFFRTQQWIRVKE